MNFFENLYKIKKFAERQAFQNKRFLSMIKRPKLEIDNRVLFRDKKAWLAPGMHAFKLVYEMTGMTGFAPEEDSIRWNVTGAGWERGVLAASCTIVPAEGAPLSHGLAFLGSAGSTDSPVDFAEAKRGDKTCFVFTAKTPVRQGHHFTVGASFPKGTVPEPALYRRKETPCSRACAPATASSPSSSASLCGGAGDALPRKSPPRRSSPRRACRSA